MEIKDYLTMARRWAWLLIIGLFLGALGGFLGSIFQTPIYQASTRILVLRALELLDYDKSRNQFCYVPP